MDMAAFAGGGGGLAVRGMHQRDQYHFWNKDLHALIRVFGPKLEAEFRFDFKIE